LYEDFSSTGSLESPPIHIVAKLPIIGVLYLAMSNGKPVVSITYKKLFLAHKYLTFIKTHRFQVKLKTTSEYTNLVAMFKQLKCPIKILDSNSEKTRSEISSISAVSITYSGDRSTKASKTSHISNSIQALPQENEMEVCNKSELTYSLIVFLKIQAYFLLLNNSAAIFRNRKNNH
jgi:hypothetical protein